MHRDHHEAEPGGHSGPAANIPGISQRAIDAFCNALEFSVYDRWPTDSESVQLKFALLQLTREAHGVGMLPERVLLGLKGVWVAVCGHRVTPDTFDPAWHFVVRMALDAYESTRPSKGRE